MATNVDMKLLKQTKFPPEFNQKVDMRKVNIEVMKKYFYPTPALVHLATLLMEVILQVDRRQDLRNSWQRR